MENIFDIINRICPEGIVYRPLLDVANVLYGYPCDASKFNDSDGRPLARIRNVLEGVSDTYTKENIPDKYTLSKGDLLVGMDGNFHVGQWRMDNGILCQRVCKIESNDNEETILNGWLCHVLPSIMKIIENKKPLGTVKHLLDKDIKSIEIPVPPLPIQEEIVRILDKFTGLEAELEVELELRKIQREGIKQRLFNFGNKAKWVVAEKICDVEKGNTPIQKAIEGKYPLVVTTVERKTNNSYQFDRPAVCIPLVSSRGHGIASLNHVYYQEGKFALGNILCALMPKNTDELDGRFLYQYLEYSKDYVLVPLMKGGANVAMHKEDIKGIKIPLIDPEKQKDIVKKIQACDEIIGLISEEIILRKKQYEYYMNLILTFNKA